MKCKVVSSIMSDYLDDKLPGHVRLEFELHIQVCDKCARELETTERVIVSLSALGSQRSPVDCWADVRSRVRGQAICQSHWYRLFLRPLIAVPALSLPILAYILLSLPPTLDNVQPGGNVISVNEYSKYLTAHSRAQRLEPLSDPDVGLVAAELEKASLTNNSEQ